MSQFVCIYRLFGENRKKNKVSPLGAHALYQAKSEKSLFYRGIIFF